MKSCEPATTAPSGQPSPFEKQIVHRVRVARPFRGREAGADGGVEEPRAVEVQLRAALVRGVDGGAELVERPDAPARAAMGVLEHDDPARAELRARPRICAGVTRPCRRGDARA